MVVCKFFLKGNCKFGDRCRYEHIRGNSNDSGGNFRNNNSDRNRNFNQNYNNSDQNRNFNQNYNNSDRNRNFSQNYNRRNDTGTSRNSFNNNYVQPSHFQNQTQTRHNKSNQGDYSSPLLRGGSSQEKSSIQTSARQDKFHWSKNSNRFGVLQDQSSDMASMEAVSEEQLTISTIQEDMKVWLQGCMWPYSCYSPSKEKQRLIEGLPDILAEELRTLYYLHGLDTYKGIMRDVDSLYTGRKQELATMSNATKQTVLANLSLTSESNPSSFLTILTMYGPGKDFKSSPTNLDKRSGSGTTAPSSNQICQPSSPQAPSFSFTALDNSRGDSSAPSSVSNTSMFKPLVGSTVPKPSATKSDPTYTDKSLLSQSEIDQFEAASFTLGKIPHRPPPAEYCR